MKTYTNVTALKNALKRKYIPKGWSIDTANNNNNVQFQFKIDPSQYDELTAQFDGAKIKSEWDPDFEVQRITMNVPKKYFSDLALAGLF